MIGELLAGRYELQDVAGSGGMSSVYRARDTVLERTVAIKILHEQYSDDPEYVERFRREARALAQLNHPNIVTVIDRGEFEGRQYLVTEYIDGGTLREWRDRTLSRNQNDRSNGGNQRATNTDRAHGCQRL